MYKYVIGTLIIGLTACKSTSEPKQAEAVVSDEEFFISCMKETNDDLQACKQRLVKRRIGFECSTPRKNPTMTRIKKETCTTAYQRKMIQERSDRMIDELQRSRGCSSCKRHYHSAVKVQLLKSDFNKCS